MSDATKQAWLRSWAGPWVLGVLLLLPLGCGTPAPPGPVLFVLNDHAAGVSETVNNIANLTVVSRHAQVLRAEYQAGFVQGHGQGEAIAAARDNNFTLVSATGGELPRLVPLVNAALEQNFTYLIAYLRTHPEAGQVLGLKRLLFRSELGDHHEVVGRGVLDKVVQHPEFELDGGQRALRFRTIHNPGLQPNEGGERLNDCWTTGALARE